MDRVPGTEIEWPNSEVSIERLVEASGIEVKRNAVHLIHSLRYPVLFAKRRMAHGTFRGGFARGQPDQ